MLTSDSECFKDVITTLEKNGMEWVFERHWVGLDEFRDGLMDMMSAARNAGRKKECRDCDVVTDGEAS